MSQPEKGVIATAPGRLDVAADELGADHPIGFEPETGRDRTRAPLEVGDRARNNVNTALQSLPRYLDSVSPCLLEAAYRREAARETSAPHR